MPRGKRKSPGWIALTEGRPPRGVMVETKVVFRDRIDVCQCRLMRVVGEHWFSVELGLVLYEPTHWRLTE